MINFDVFAVREKNQKSDFQVVIERALSIACDTLIPRGLDNSWRDLSLVERYFLRALDIESRGERRQGMYEELARGFGVTDIKPLLKSDKANGARMYTPSGLSASLLGTATGSVPAEPLSARRGRASSGVAHPFASCPLRGLDASRQAVPKSLEAKEMHDKIIQKPRVRYSINVVTRQ